MIGPSFIKLLRFVRGVLGPLIAIQVFLAGVGHKPIMVHLVVAGFGVLGMWCADQVLKALGED